MTYRSNFDDEPIAMSKANGISSDLQKMTIFEDGENLDSSEDDDFGIKEKTKNLNVERKKKTEYDTI